MTWFQRAHNPQAITEDYEQGGYFYFDWENSWCQRKKSDFRFEVSFSEVFKLTTVPVALRTLTNPDCRTRCIGWACMQILTRRFSAANRGRGVDSDCIIGRNLGRPCIGVAKWFQEPKASWTKRHLSKHALIRSALDDDARSHKLPVGIGTCREGKLHSQGSR